MLFNQNYTNRQDYAILLPIINSNSHPKITKGMKQWNEYMHLLTNMVHLDGI